MPKQFIDNLYKMAERLSSDDRYMVRRAVREIDNLESDKAALVEALRKVLAEYEDGYGLKCIDEVRAALRESKTV